MPLPSKIVLATHNAGKVMEFQKLFEPYNVKIIGAGDVGLPEPEETEDTFEGNALLKARHACAITAMPCLADDSGLAVNALGGAPGIYSARWAGESKDFEMAMKRVHDEIGDHEDRGAQFVAVLALVLPDETEILSRGEVEGMIAPSVKGQNGFGYDPIFVPYGETRTFGEMSAEEKKKHSHRNAAFYRLVTEING